ncbi:gamma-glutamylcyclotransferase family protein [Streptomyces orinoci]|uniref:Gamma-glutamylcyclotransferase family protein n=1 Tax=Streptomyces orinoci TaxID=67339 RepID=A0ABV3JR35_STRON|nr:gamma-glutamylcyclotransferase family protein [Streptomyces orinoci]
MPQLPLFVYGTLRPGRHNYARYLQGHTTAEKPARLRGAALYEGPGYPFAVPAPHSQVHGDLITLAPAGYAAVLTTLDALEGYAPGAPDNLYERVALPVELPTGERPPAWVYLATPTLAHTLRTTGTPIPHGRWPHH